jgi:hypothetical protein
MKQVEILTLDEALLEKGIPLQKSEIKGHYRTTKTGKRVFVKPHQREGERQVPDETSSPKKKTSVSKKDSRTILSFINHWKDDDDVRDIQGDLGMTEDQKDYGVDDWDAFLNERPEKVEQALHRISLIKTNW